MGVPGDSPWRRGSTPRLLGVLGLLVVAGGVGDTLSAVLVVHSPLLLVALNPRARNVLLASRTVGAAPLFTVGLVRRLLTIPVVYRLGRIHGDASLAWVDRRFPRTGRWTRRVERWFDRAAIPVVLLFPGALTAYLAGSAGMHEALVLCLSTLGFAARLAGLLVAGDVLDRPLSWLLGIIAAHQMLLLSLSIAFTAVQVARLRRRLRRPVTGVELVGRPAELRSPGADPVEAGALPTDMDG